jgi:predicted ABC-type ATPase
VTLYFLRLDSPELAIARVAERVRQGGHHVTDDVILRRFHAGMNNFYTVYRPLVDDWMLFDNGGEEPTLLEWGEKS